MRNVLALLVSYLEESFVVLDVGARGGLGEPWQAMAGLHLKNSQSLIQGIFFEADPEEASSLAKQLGATVLPYAVGGGDEMTLHLTKARRCSSCLEPNMSLLDRFPEVDRFIVEKKIPIQTRALDELFTAGSLTRCDFAKLDVQGLELDVLYGGKNYFSPSLLGLEIEVEFKEMYKNQPLFRDVDKFVSEELGMELFDIQRFFFKYKEGQGIGQPRGQLVFGNALYMLTPESVVSPAMQTLDQVQLLARCLKAVLMATSYGQYDYALRLLRLMQEHNFLPEKQCLNLNNALTKDAYRLHFLQNKFSNILYKWAQIVIGLFRPMYNEWGTCDPALGSPPRSRKVFWY